MSPDYIGPATPIQTVELRLGRFSRYPADGGGHQPWDEAHYPCAGRVGTPASNTFREEPWQSIWVPTTAYATIPNVLSVKLDKKKEIGGIATATIEIENIAYVDGGGYHLRERGYLSPLRGFYAHGDELSPDIPQLLDELGAVIASNEWKGRFSYAAQVTVHQGYGTPDAKTFTGLIEDVDSTSHPDRITITCRDFGQVFTEEHFFGWNKDPVIDTPVIFVDRVQAANKHEVGYNPHASMEDVVNKHLAEDVLDFDESTSWQTNTVHSAEQTEYVEIALPAGRYKFAFATMMWGGMEVFVALRAAEQAGGAPPTRNGVPMTEVNKWLDKNGWVDVTKKEEQIVPGEEGGNSYTRKYESYPAGHQLTPLDVAEADYVIGANSVLRFSFRKLHAVAGGWRAGVKELHGRREELSEMAGRAEWVTVEDIADVIRVICQWAGFKEWDIPDTGTRLPQRLVAHQSEAYIDIIKRVCEGIGYEFFIADPAADSAPRGVESLGIPTFRKSRVIADDAEAIPVITDKTLLTAINLKQSNEPLAYVIRTYGRTLSLPGDAKAAIAGGKRLVYTFRPPWTGTPPEYKDSRLAGILKQVVYTDALFSTPELVRNAAWFIALQQALASIQATIQIPAFPALDLDDHALLMDLGTGLTTRISVSTRSSTFTDGEKRKWEMQLTGPLIDTPDVRDMVNIINGVKVANGIGTQWGDPHEGTGSSLGYG